MHELRKVEHCGLEAGIVTMNENERLPALRRQAGQFPGDHLRIDPSRAYDCEVACRIGRAWRRPLNCADVAVRWDGNDDVFERKVVGAFAVEQNARLIAALARCCYEHVDLRGARR